jgi:hypothetical protein
MSDSDISLILEKLNGIEKHLEAKQYSHRWLSMTEACEYAGGRSKNWMLDKLNTGKIHGYQEDGKKGFPGKWVIDKNSIDDFYSGLKEDTNKKYLDLKKRTGG